MIADQRYGYINSIIKQGVLQQKYDQNRLYTSDKIDKVVTNRFLGPIIMIASLMALYHFTFTYSEIPVGWFESFFGWLGDAASTHLPDGLLKSLVVSGVIDGVGGVLGFVPLIMFMFSELPCWKIPGIWQGLHSCWTGYFGSSGSTAVPSWHI